jgi:hypothetical protein
VTAVLPKNKLVPKETSIKFKMLQEGVRILKSALYQKLLIIDRKQIYIEVLNQMTKEKVEEARKRIKFRESYYKQRRNSIPFPINYYELGIII